MKTPLSKLPYCFQKRLIALAPLRILNDLGRVLPGIRMFRSFCPKAYDKVFITDHPNVYKWATKDTFVFEMFKLLYQFTFLSYLLDGSDNVNPVWQAVLCVDEIIDKKQAIYVEDTLVLYCESINEYQKVIPYICGPYTRLVLHGNINMHQIISLLHPDVNKIRINANIQIPPLSHDHFAELMVKQVQGTKSSLTICNNKSLEEMLRLTCRRQKKWFTDKKEYFSITTHDICSYLRPLLFHFINGAVCALSTRLLFVIEDWLYPTLFVFILYIDLCVYGILTKRILYPERFVVVDEIDSDVLQNINSQNCFSAAFSSLWSAIDTIMFKLYKFVVKE
uniref:F-box domain-containing protein n=1 Tax=Panagrellus redivivus TaxID=6233 RepID=A0A7E4VT25_PANRE